MSHINLEEFRQLLLNERQQLIALTEQGSAAAETVQLDQTRVGRLSRMDALQGQAMSVERKRLRGQRLSQIEQALKRIDSDGYGDCEQCAEAIAEARLRLNPAATLCIRCAEARET